MNPTMRATNALNELDAVIFETLRVALKVAEDFMFAENKLRSEKEIELLIAEVKANYANVEKVQRDFFESRPKEVLPDDATVQGSAVVIQERSER